MDLLLDKSFSLVAHQLRSMRVQPIGAVMDNLNAKRSQIKIITTARRAGLGKDQRLKTLECIFNDGAYCEKVIEILSEELPLMNLDMEDCWDDEGNYILAINPDSYSTWTFDDANDRLSDVGDMMPWFSLTAFLLLMNWGIDSDLPEFWKNAIAHFNWPFDGPISLEYSIPIDEKYLKRYLAKRDLTPLYKAIQQAWFPPDNVFLYCNMEDPDSVYYEFTVDNLKLLRRDWKKAKPYLEQYDIASLMVEEDPGKLRILVDGLRESQVSSQKNSSKLGKNAGLPMVAKDIILRSDPDPLYETDDQDLDDEDQNDD